MAEGSGSPVVRAHVVGVTDVGRVREHNEDAFLVLDPDQGKPVGPGQVLDAELRRAVVMVVCDGMGGAAAGEVASRMASQRVAETLSKADFGTAQPDQIATLMDQAVQSANEEIFKKAKAEPELKGMGTTLTAAVVTPGRLFVSQVGDSRAYLLRKGHLNQITKDQSLIGQLIEEGTLTEEEAEKLGGKNIVLQAVGVEENLRVDTKHWPLLRGDTVLLCSDGLTGMVKDARMRDVLTEKGEDLRAAAHQLIQDANDGGGRDNITVVLSRFDGEGLRPPMETEAAAGMEAAGATFKAPPPPEVPNPMKKVALWGGILFAAIAVAFAILRPTKAFVTVPVLPEGAEVKLFDAAGKELLTKVAGAAPVSLDELAPGPYRLQVTANLHFEETQDLNITDKGKKELPEVRLVPKPGIVVARAEDPDVTARIAGTPSHPKSKAIREDFRLPTPGESFTFKDVAAGEIEVTASRPGFRPWTWRGPLAPTETKEVRVPRLEELKGRLVVAGCEGGHVEVRAATGDPLAEADAAGPTWQGDVRAVRVRVLVSWKGYRTFSAEVDVPEGGTANVTAERTADKVPVRVRAVPDGVVVLERHDGARWVKVDEAVADQAGVAALRNQPPGRYRASLDGAEPWTEFEIAPGAQEASVGVKGK